MNYDLIKKLEEKENELRVQRRNLALQYEKLRNSGDLSKENIEAMRFLYDSIIGLDKDIVIIRDAVKNAKRVFGEYANSRSKDTAEAVKAENKKLEALAEKYCPIELLPEIEPEPEKTGEVEEEHSTEKKHHPIRNIIGGALAITAIAGIGYHVGTAIKNNKHDDVVQEQVIDDEIDIVNTNTLDLSNKPFEHYGEFLDASDENQVNYRANWYYETYLAGLKGANSVGLRDIAEDIRMINGEFMLDEEYNPTQIINVGNDIHTIGNYSSFKQFGTDIKFVPMAPLFVDGSIAQKGALEMDDIMKDVVSAINSDDQEAFVEASQRWGVALLNMCEYVDGTGEYVNINQASAPSAYQLYNAVISKYNSTINEYCESRGLNICIDFCTNLENGKIEQIALSDLVYNINNRSMDAVAVRSGHLEEYQENNVSIPQNLGQNAEKYFTSKYQLEKGQSLTLSK